MFFSDMTFQLSSVEEALNLASEQECSVAMKVLEIGDIITYQNAQKRERKYFLIKAADETTMVTVRNYQIKSRASLEAGRTYAFINVKVLQVIFLLEILGFSTTQKLFSLFSHHGSK